MEYAIGLKDEMRLTDNIGKVVFMLLDITYKLNAEAAKTAWSNTNKSLVGHIGTHFDVMNKQFPLEYSKCNGIVFNVSTIRGRDIEIEDIDLDLVNSGAFVAFYTDYINEVGFGTKQYFTSHPQLSVALINALLDKGVSIIGIDCGGIRSGKEHTPTDRLCAERGAFVVESLANLNVLCAHCTKFTAYTFPLSMDGLTGLPCRVVAEIA